MKTKGKNSTDSKARTKHANGVTPPVGADHPNGNSGRVFGQDGPVGARATK